MVSIVDWELESLFQLGVRYFREAFLKLLKCLNATVVNKIMRKKQILILSISKSVHMEKSILDLLEEQFYF